ncbi:hypothetical protein TrRE_jg5960 [Triparma retinervis]|uniref:Uncharacterized protein n=1 Tax=Triparma retinervis TaxID=2557542 RepID=A0A9W6ZMX4_9STRA|nr:hypothetical protein TrRE_jg5960 [Triparma retinervis]
MHAANCGASSPPSCGAGEKAQAALDFHKILTARSAELKPGGRMVIVNFSKSPEGHYLGKTDVGASMWDSFSLCWKRLHAEGLIDDSELVAVSFPSYYRSQSEVSLGVSSVPGLKLISISELVVRCPYRASWTSGASTSAGRSPLDHAKWYVPTTRTWSESTFLNALRPGRSDASEVMERFWGNYVDLVAEEPGIHGMDYVHTYTVLEKE